MAFEHVSLAFVPEFQIAGIGSSLDSLQLSVKKIDPKWLPLLGPEFFGGECGNTLQGIRQSNQRLLKKLEDYKPLRPVRRLLGRSSLMAEIEHYRVDIATRAADLDFQLTHLINQRHGRQSWTDFHKLSTSLGPTTALEPKAQARLRLPDLENSIPEVHISTNEQDLELMELETSPHVSNPTLTPEDLPPTQPQPDIQDLIINITPAASVDNDSQDASTPSLAEIWDWYLRTGFGVLTLSASLITALMLIVGAKKDLSTAFTVASWVLVAGTMLAVTMKTCLWERPGREITP